MTDDLKQRHMNYLRRKTADESELWAAERIEQLEAERDSFYMEYRIKCDEQTKALHIERDELMADNARLREALQDLFDESGVSAVYPLMDTTAERKARQALAATEPTSTPTDI